MNKYDPGAVEVPDSYGSADDYSSADDFDYTDFEY